MAHQQLVLTEIRYRDLDTKLPTQPLSSITLWVMTEFAIIGSDIQEVVGSAIAFKLLFNLPLWVGTLITGLDTFTFLGFHYFGIRKLEAFFCTLIFAMCVCFFINWGEANTDGEKFTPPGAFMADAPVRIWNGELSKRS